VQEDTASDEDSEPSQGSNDPDFTPEPSRKRKKAAAGSDSSS